MRRCVIVMWMALALLPLPLYGGDARGPIVLDISCKEGTELYTVEEDGSNLKRITSFAAQQAWAAHPTWSPDGRQVLFAVIWHGGGVHRSEVFVMSLDGAAPRRITNTPDGKSSWNAAWSPGGKRIVFTSDRAGNPDLYMMKSTGGQAEALTKTEGKDRHSWNPAWSPDGRFIAFESNRTGSDEIYLLEVATRKVRALTHTPEGQGSWTPAWSPDGKMIAFASDRDVKSELYVVDADGSNVRRLKVEVPGRPKWSPNGKKLIVQREDTPQRESVWTVNVDGTELKQLVAHKECSVRHPDWKGRRR